MYPYSVVDTDEVVRFMNVKFSYGIQSLSTFMRSSVFTCEKPGLYMVSVDIVSNTYDAFLVIVKNDVILSINLTTSSVSTTLYGYIAHAVTATKREKENEKIRNYYI
jgi:hypothetical protein